MGRRIGHPCVNEQTKSGIASVPIRERHQALTMTLHWLTVVAVLGQFGLAFAHAQASDAGVRHTALTTHRSLGTDRDVDRGSSGLATLRHADTAIPVVDEPVSPSRRTPE